jgi:hypothetical protein
MNRLRLLSFAVLSSLLFVNSAPPFPYTLELKNASRDIYKDTLRYRFRMAQLYCESGFNPRSTSEVKPWKRSGMDTVTAVKTGRAAAGIGQFMLRTAEGYGVKTVNPAEADSLGFAQDIYNPAWSIRANCQYMIDLECIIYRGLESDERIKFRNSRKLRELYCCSAYNCGSYRVLRAIQSNGINWAQTKSLLPNESITYAERVVMEKEKWFGK